MQRKAYGIIMTFTYNNGQAGGVLDTTKILRLYGQKQITAQIKINEDWLARQGHTLNTTTVVEL